MIWRVLQLSFMTLLLTAIAAALVPPSYWYEVRSVIVADAVTGTPNQVTAYREIKRPFKGSYHVIIRGVDDASAVCDAASNVFPYRPMPAVLLVKDMAWWAPSDPRCSNLPPGTYVMDTTWTIHGPFYRLSPDKSFTITSNPFMVLP